MAIVRCPKCGKEISEKSNHCVYCGTPIFVCPECGHASAGNGGVCPNCGYSVPAKSVPHGSVQDKPQGEEKKEGSDDIIVQWLAANPKEQKWYKPFGLILNLATIVPFIALIAVAVALFFAIERPFETLYKNNDPTAVAELIENHEVYIRTAWILVSVVLVCMLGEWICMSYAIMARSRCLKWLKSKKIDFHTSLRKESDEFLRNPTQGQIKWGQCTVPNGFKAAVYYSAFEKSQVVQIFDCIYQFFSCIGLAPFLFYFAYLTCGIIEDNAVLGLQTKLGPECLIGVCIIAGVVLAVILLLSFVRQSLNGKIKKRLDQELAKN